MATSLLLLLDDIATMLDDVAVLTKIAARKTAGVLGDDLALNAQQVAGVRAEREIPVVWAVAKGSFRNKAILVPAALGISAFAPWAVSPLLMIGGAFLCYEGFEKLAHKVLHRPSTAVADRVERVQALAETPVDLMAVERDKIRGAIRTDFVLSAEIIAITLGTVAAAPFLSQVAVLSGVAVIMTVGVYGIVAGIVKLDDAGLYLSQRSGEGLFGGIQRRVGRGILGVAPWLMKALSVAGTAAMFMVGGGILVHGIPRLHHALEQAAHWAADKTMMSSALELVGPVVLNAAVGVVAGALALVGVVTVKRMVRMFSSAPA